MATVNIADYVGALTTAVTSGDSATILAGGVFILRVTSTGQGSSYGYASLLVANAPALATFVPQKIASYKFATRYIFEDDNAYTNSSSTETNISVSFGEEGLYSSSFMYPASAEGEWSAQQTMTDVLVGNSGAEPFEYVRVQNGLSNIYNFGGQNVYADLRVDELVLEGTFLQSDFWTGYQATVERAL